MHGEAEPRAAQETACVRGVLVSLLHLSVVGWKEVPGAVRLLQFMSIKEMVLPSQEILSNASELCSCKDFNLLKLFPS